MLLILFVGLVGGVGAYHSLAMKAAAQQRDLLGAMAQCVIGAFDLQLVRAVEALQTTSHLLSTQPRLTHAQFAHFGAALLDESSVMTLLEWQPAVPGGKLAEFEAQAALERPGFRVVEPAPGQQGDSFIVAQPRELHVPVLYSWPETGAAVGVDMAFDARRMRSKLLARDTGGPVASETFALIRRDEAGPQVTGFAVSLPVYRSARPADVAARRHELQGFLAGVIGLPALMHEAALRAEANDLDLFVFDQEEQHRLVYASTGDKPFSTDARDMAYSLDVGGRPWQIVLRPRPGFAVPGGDAMPPVALGAAALATLLVAFAVARSLAVRRRLERTEAVLAQDRQHLTNVLEGTAAGTWDWHVDSGHLVINERWAQMLGRSREELHPITVRTWERLCHADDLIQAYDALKRHFDGEDERFTAEFRARHADGHWVWVQSIGRVFERDATGRALRVAGTHMDISRRKADEQRLHDDARALEAANRQLRDLAILDALTGAFNRRHFNDVCLTALAGGAQRGHAVALCMLDVDHFKAYNDHYGHQAGDAVLQALAQTLKDALKRSTDALFRVGGEEFCVIFSALTAEAAQHFVGQLIAALHALALPHEHSPRGIVTASFGLAWWAVPTSRLTPESMYAAADAALYEAKRTGRDRVVTHAFQAGEAKAEAPASGR